MRRMFCVALAFCGMAGALAGCQHPSVSAVSLNAHHCDHHFAFLYDPCKEPEGIPFYLPKPLLIVSKNFRNIEEAKVGLTDTAPIPDGFDDQSKYADLNARTNFNFGGTSADKPGGTQAGETGNQNAPGSTATKSGAYTYGNKGPNVTPGVVESDGLAPNTFYTYQIIFVPDMSQKYGLKIRGGAGEIRAAMNLVNGWQFTGIGPFYMKDSSTSQNILSGGIATRLGGQAVADVLKGVAGLARPGAGNQSGELDSSSPKVQQLARAIGQLPREQFPIMQLPDFAQIHVFEPKLGPDGQMEWCEIVNLSFNRDYLGSDERKFQFPPVAAQTKDQKTDSAGPSGATGAQSGSLDVMTKMAISGVAGAFGVSPTTSALSVDQGLGTQAGNFGTQAGGVPGVPSGPLPPGSLVTSPFAARQAKPSLLGGTLGHLHKNKQRGSTTTRAVIMEAPLGQTPPTTVTRPQVPKTPEVPTTPKETPKTNPGIISN